MAMIVDDLQTSPMVVDDLQMVNNALVSLGYETLPAFDSPSSGTHMSTPQKTKNTTKVLRTIQKLASQRRRDMALIESTSNRLKACEADRRRLSSDKKQLLLQVKGLESDLKNALFQIEAKEKKYKKHKKQLEDVKVQLEKRCARLQTRDMSYQAKIRKKEVEYEKLKERLQNKHYNENGSKGRLAKRKASNNGSGRGSNNINRGKAHTLTYGTITLSENVQPSIHNIFQNKDETAHEQAKANNLTSIVNDMYIEKQKELVSENGRFKLQISNMEAQLNELQRIVNEQDMILRKAKFDGSEGAENHVERHDLDTSPVNTSLGSSGIDWAEVNLKVDLAGLEK